MASVEQVQNAINRVFKYYDASCSNPSQELTDKVLDLLAPEFGLYGVCMALAGANIAMFAYRTVVAQKFYCSIVSYKRTVLVIAVMFVLVFAACVLSENFVAKLAVSLAGMVVYIIIYRRQLVAAIGLAKELIGGFLAKRKQ